MSPCCNVAVLQAKQYDAATAEYPASMASRRNCDVAEGTDGTGLRRSSALEPSWRSGGASTAELEALALFVPDLVMQVMEACAVKHFGAGHEPPHRAVVHFRVTTRGMGHSYDTRS